MILLTTEANWRDFVVEQENQIDKLSDKALFSRVGRQSKYDYNVDFSDTQETQVLRHRILKAHSAIEIGLKVAEGLQSFCEKLRKDGDNSIEPWLPELAAYASRLCGHKSSFTRLLEITQGTQTLLLKILDYRHDEVIQHNAKAMRDLLAISQREGDTMRVIAQKTQQDSRTMKIVTFVAIVYLPATLVASIFSSSIVNPDDHSNLGFSATPSLAAFSLITIFLTVLTIVATLLWDKGYLKSPRTRGCRALA